MYSTQKETFVRRVQITGGTTFIVSLPKAWANSHSLKAKENIMMDWRPSGALRLTPTSQKKSQKNMIILNVNNIPQDSLLVHLVAAYIASAEEIKIKCNDEFNRKQLNLIRTFMRITSGFEIIEENPQVITLVNLLNIGELPLRSSINRMYLQLTSIIRDVLLVIEGEDVFLLSDVEDREREIDSLRLLIARQVGALLESHKVAAELNMDRRHALEHVNLASAYERMGDHAYQFALLVRDTENRPKLNMDSFPLSLFQSWQTSLKKLMINYRQQNSVEIYDARTALKKIQTQLEEHENNMWGGRASATKLLFDFRISELLRRLCAYSRDVGEIILNMMACEKIQVSSTKS